GLLNDKVDVVVKTFFTTFTAEKFVVPICCAMGFAHVLKTTRCDEHLVHLLTKPLRRGGLFLVPGAIIVGFVVNIPIISQTSSALAVGAVLVPLLLRAGVPAATVGATLLLGCSAGGELLNPGAPELNTVATALGINPATCVRYILPLVLAST